MVLRFKEVAFESIDALAVSERGRLLAVNPRAEVPVLADGALIVANSADIVAYLEDADFLCGDLSIADLALFLASGTSPYEGEQVVWRGDRIEWLIARGYWDWFRSELVSGRAVVPRSIQVAAQQAGGT
jgi:glutathione S-transferase